MKKEDIIIIGAGAAGMAASIEAARKGGRVLLIEGNKKAGKKILVSGNGRCNIGNSNITPKRYFSHNPVFVEKVLKGYDADTVSRFLFSIGLELEEEAEGKLFPMSRQASTVVSMLETEAKRLGVQFCYETHIRRIKQNGKTFLLNSDKEEFIAKKVLLSAGSPAAPQLGGSNRAILAAQSLGHRIIPPRPSLVALESEEKWTAQAAGVKMNAKVTLYANGVPTSVRSGDILFTDYGISGLAILDISRELSLRLAEWEFCELKLDLMPQFGKAKLKSMLQRRISKERKLPLYLWLSGVIHKKLVPVIIEKSSIKATNESNLGTREIGNLVYTIKNLSLSISQTRDFRYAEVATGGVDTLDVNPETMESLKLPGLYFAGEILDVDGDRGGFNFHFAWSSGLRAARAMCR